MSPPAAAAATSADRPAVAATDPSARGRGHGSAVLAELHRQAVLRGVAEVELHAQASARGFSERAGHAVVGEECEEAGITHITMRRSLPRPHAGDECD